MQTTHGLGDGSAGASEVDAHAVVTGGSEGLAVVEAEFGLIRPVRLPSGHRRYSKADVYTILKIKDLIYKHKMTLEGAKKQLLKHPGGFTDRENSTLDIKLLTEIKETLSQLLKEC